MGKGLAMVSFVLFCIGLILSVIGGIAIPANTVIIAVLAIFGLIIGIIYVIYSKNNGNLHTLLLATIALLAMAAAFTPITNLWSGKVVSSIIINFAALMSPVALIAAIKALLVLGFQDKVKI